MGQIWPFRSNCVRYNTLKVLLEDDFMPLKIVVTVKQVPDTQNVGTNAMKPDGTVNRGVLPAIFNPEDLNALEEAIKIKEKMDAYITVVTMGPAKAIEVLKQSLYRGADEVVLISDRVFAGADTLATSYILKLAIEKISNVDLILCGRQAIDGDTAQVGPQIAEKLKINQLTCVNQICEIGEKSVVVKRSLDDGVEVSRSSFPVLLTITNDANEPRSPSARRVMAYKDITTSSCSYDTSYIEQKLEGPSVVEWNADSLGADPARCGLNGSPTKVKKIQNVVLAANEIKQVACSVEGISELMRELRQEHILG